MFTLAATACGKKGETIDTPTSVDINNTTVAPEESVDTNNSEESDYVTSDLEDGVYYTLNGVRVDHPSKGVYIFNGKKVVIK